MIQRWKRVGASTTVVPIVSAEPINTTAHSVSGTAASAVWSPGRPLRLHHPPALAQLCGRQPD